MKIFFYFLILFISFSLTAQDLHHQMISSQATSVKTSHGLIIKQTIGQQTVSGTSKSDLVVMQGFQQNYWLKFIVEKSNQKLSVITFPNPFVKDIIFHFNSMTDSAIHISIFNVAGSTVFSNLFMIKNHELTLDLSYLPRSTYLVRISNDKINYFTKIIKE